MKAVRRLPFESATTIFNPETVQPLPEDIVHDFPAGGWRFRELASGIHATIVNGQVLLEDGKHTGTLPGRVVRHSLCTAGA